MTTLLESLKFVQGAVSKKDFLPELTHFIISDGTVRGFNGTIALSSPISLDITCNPQAEPLVKAIQACSDNIVLSLLPTGRLSIKSGKFRCIVPCHDNKKFKTEPEGEMHEINGDKFLAAMKKIYPIISTDASRAWSMGTLLLNQSAFATNNVVIIEHWLGFDFPVCCCVPRLAIQELLRIDLPPKAIQISDKSITFHFDENKWLRSQLFDSKAWPDVYKVLDKKSDQQKICMSFFDALKILKPFIDKVGIVYFTEGLAHTANDTNNGAQIQFENIGRCAFNYHMLTLLDGVAETIDLSAYPGPCLFFGEDLRGAIIGFKRTDT